MIDTVEFNELSTMLLDFVDSDEGFLYLRMAGAETAVNAIWAYLSARDSRGKKWSSRVQIPGASRAYTQYVAAAKQVTYRTLRTRLPSGMVDLAMVHPRLTVAEDNPRGFYLLAYEPGLPPGFFERLNRALSVPLKPEWATWLWEQGQQSQAFFVLVNKVEWEQGQQVKQTVVTETRQTPIIPLKSLGSVACYSVSCSGDNRIAWLEIIRRQLHLSLPLKKVRHTGNSHRYESGTWTIYPQPEGWALHRADERLLQAASLNHLLTEARDTLGLYFTL